MLGLERLVGKCFKFRTVNGTLEELDEGLPVASAVLAKGDCEFLLEIEGVGADGSMWWCVSAGGRAHFASDIDHGGRASTGCDARPKSTVPRCGLKASVRGEVEPRLICVNSLRIMKQCTWML